MTEMIMSKIAKPVYRYINLFWGQCLLLLFLSCSNKSPIEKWHEMYDKEWAQSQLDSILSPYLHMDWDKTSLKITFSDVVPPVIEEYGKCREYGNTQLKVYSVWSLPFDNADDAYPISFYVRYGDVTVLSKASDGTIKVELDSAEFENAVIKYRQDQQEKEEEKRAALQERKNAVDLANRNKTRVHFGMSSKEYYSCDKLFRENFVNGLIGEGAFNSYFDPDFSNGKFVGFEVRNRNYDILFEKAKMLKRNSYNESHRYTIVDTNYSTDLYNARVSEIIPKGRGDTSTTITVYWNGYSKIYTK